MNNYQTVSIQFTKSDAEKLTEKAKSNRLKLSSYLRYVITKNHNSFNFFEFYLLSIYCQICKKIYAKCMD